MAEHLLNDLGVLPGRQQDGGARMPQIVETDARERARLERRVEFAPDIPFVQWRPDGAREHDADVAPAFASQQPFSSLR